MASGRLMDRWMDRRSGDYNYARPSGCIQNKQTSEPFKGQCLCQGRQLFRVDYNKVLTRIHLDDKFKPFQRVPCGSVVKCLTRNPGVLGSSRTGSSGFFHGGVLGQDTSEPSLVLVKPRKARIMRAVAVI